MACRRVKTDPGAGTKQQQQQQKRTQKTHKQPPTPASRLEIMFGTILIASPLLLLLLETL